MDPRGTVSRIYKEDDSIFTIYESSGPCGFGEDLFMFFPLYVYMGANDPRRQGHF